MKGFLVLYRRMQGVLGYIVRYISVKGVFILYCRILITLFLMYSNMVGSLHHFSLCKSIGYGVCFLRDHDILMQLSDPDENS